MLFLMIERVMGPLAPWESSVRSALALRGLRNTIVAEESTPPCTDNKDNRVNPVMRLICRRNQTNQDSLKKAVNHIYNTVSTDFCGLPLYRVTCPIYK